LAQEARWAGVGNRVMSRPISAMKIAAAVGPIPGISSSRAAASAKGARGCSAGDRGTAARVCCPIWVSTAVMSRSTASTRASIRASRNR
jgi:hypothetical protein